jgi:hypothetical protein
MRYSMIIILERLYFSSKPFEFPIGLNEREAARAVGTCHSCFVRTSKDRPLGPTFRLAVLLSQFPPATILFF